MSQDQRALLLLRLLRDSYEQPVIKRGGACVWQQRALTWAEVRESGKLIMGSVSPAIVTFGGETLNPVTSSGDGGGFYLHELLSHPQVLHDSKCVFLSVPVPVSVPQFLFFCFLRDLKFRTGNDVKF